MQFDFIGILLILSMGQCLLLLISLISSQRSQQYTNLFLGLILIIFLWYQIEFFLIRQSTRFGSWFLVGPLVFWYYQSLFKSDFQIKASMWWHLVPFVVFTLILPFLFTDLITSRAVDYGMLTVFDSWNQQPITWKHYLFGLVFIAQYIHALFYLNKSHHNLKLLNVQWEGHPHIENSIKSHRHLVLGAMLVIIAGALFIGIQFITQAYRRPLDYLYVLPMMGFIYLMAFRSLRVSNGLLKVEFPIKKYQKSSLSPSAANAYQKLLHTKIQEEKWYRKPGLSLTMLAQELEISTHHLSQVINEQHQKHFFDYINEYRVLEAKHLIAENPKLNLLEIAYQVGFNNKNSFNNAFKKHVGQSPTDYKKSIG